MGRLAHVDQRLNQPKVAIIGGGWAGLAAAVELCAAGVPVAVFEAARQLGGRARRIEIDGHTLDNGQHILIGAYRETLRLMRRIHAPGTDPEQLFLRLPLTIRHPASGFHMRLLPSSMPFPAQLRLALGLLGTQACTLSEKIAATRFIRALQAKRYQLDADTTVDALLDRSGQTGTLRRMLWDPLCLAALNTPPERASAQIFANVLRDSLGGDRRATDLLLPAADLGRVLPDAAAAFIIAQGGSVHLSRRIERIAREEQCWRIDGEAYDQVIVATAPQHAIPFLEEHAETRGIAAQLAAYDYEPIGTVYAAYPPDLRLPMPMLGLSDDAGEHLGQWAFDRGRLCGTPGIIAFVLSARGRWDERDNMALMAALHRELEETLRQPLPQPAWHRTIRERRATFSCRPNLPRPAASTPLTGLWLAGDYICADYPATLEGAVRSGIEAAERILALP